MRSVNALRAKRSVLEAQHTRESPRAPVGSVADGVHAMRRKRPRSEHEHSRRLPQPSEQVSERKRKAHAILRGRVHRFAAKEDHNRMPTCR